MIQKEIRERILESSTHTSIKEVATLFKVHFTTVYRYIRLAEETGSLESRTYRCGRKPSLSPDDCQRIAQLLHEQPNISIHAIREQLHLNVCNETVRKIILKIKPATKKRSRTTTRKKAPKSTKSKVATV